MPLQFWILSLGSPIMQNILRLFFIGLLFPLLVQYVCYYQFTTNYTTNAFSEAGFNKMYNTSVYQARILGRELQEFTYKNLMKIEKFRGLKENAGEDNFLFSSNRLQYMDPSADPVFYFSYFLLASVFTILAAILLLIILHGLKLSRGSPNSKDLAVCITIIFIGLTQFVVTPYDNPGYFFMALGMLFFLHNYSTGNRASYFLLLLTIAIATFNRETSLLILSFMAAVFFSREGWKISWIRKMIPAAVCFLLPYIFLKFGMGESSNITEESKLAVNLDIRNSYAIRGLAFGAFLLYFMLFTLNRQKSSLIKNFIIFSLPYLIIIHAVGVMIEYRLWVPVLLGAIVLSFLPATSSVPSATLDK
jgi:hypothetical protein